MSINKKIVVFSFECDGFSKQKNFEHKKTSNTKKLRTQKNSEPFIVSSEF